ncbi:MAG: hypothetical protein Q4P18_02920 [Methanobrevibacter sp.]|uniref:hypothetical protein n=1 Tax=Methanobrevibacter sp. TaxID=66852 RepID=UPI0026E0B775|nr:hypothetical protein [Methanobrevibacter sp.]MDO5848463.1 hypothetical protein [Methanobrevibacter sp.]
MEKNQIKAKGFSNGREVYVDLIYNDDGTVCSKYGDRMLCTCTGRTGDTATQFVYDGDKVYCPSCNRTLEVVETYEDSTQN